MYYDLKLTAILDLSALNFLFWLLTKSKCLDHPANEILCINELQKQKIFKNDKKTMILVYCQIGTSFEYTRGHMHCTQKNSYE